MKNSTDRLAAAHKASRRIWVGSALLVLLVAVLAGLVAAKARSGDKNKNKDKEVVPLQFIASEVTRPLQFRMPLVVEFSGPLAAPRTAIVRAKTAGTLLSLSVAEGSRVGAGQVIGAIDLADLQSRAADRAALVDSAQANLMEAERQNTANVDLAAQNFISATALQTSQARLEAARAALKSAQAQLASSRLGIREATLAAPISGIVGKRHVVPGEKVSSEQQIVTVVDLSTLELMGSVGTQEVSLLAPDQPVEVRIEGQAKPVPGKIDRIAPAAEAGTRAIGVVVVLANPNERLRAGQYAQARVELVDTSERLTVPAGALGQSSGQDYVWTIERGALVRRIVVTGRRDPASGRAEVVQGLLPQAVVLAVRFDNLKEGAPAFVVAQRAGVSGAPSAASASAPVAPRS